MLQSWHSNVGVVYGSGQTTVNSMRNRALWQWLLLYPRRTSRFQMNKSAAQQEKDIADVIKRADKNPDKTGSQVRFVHFSGE
jgi:hypothetical protein